MPRHIRRCPLAPALLALWLATGFAATAAGPAAAEPPTPPTGARTVPATRVATAVLVAAPADVSLPEKVGVLEAALQLEESFEVTGRIARVRGEGASVEAGDEIAALESALEIAELRQTELRLRDARNELRRVRGLEVSKAASRKALDAAVIAVGLREAEHQVATERLARRTLYARFAGVLTDVRIDPGEVTAPGAPIATLLQFELLHLEVGVPGYQMRQIRQGAPVHVAVPALQGEVFPGTVHVVSPAAAKGEHLFNVEILVPNTGRRLRPGMSAHARIVTMHLDSALRVPLSSVVRRDGARVVFFVDGARAHAIHVEAAPLVGDAILLTGALPYRELVVRGQHSLRDGFEVEVDNHVLAGLGDSSRGNPSAENPKAGAAGSVAAQVPGEGAPRESAAP